MAKVSLKKRSEYSEKERIESGLIAVFPCFEAYKSFVQTDTGNIEPFIRLAVKNHIIEEESKEAFEIFIKDKCIPIEKRTAPAGLTFRKLVEDKNRTGLSGRALCNWLNRLIKDFELNILPAGRINNSMITRLKKHAADTCVRRNTLRLLSFWFGYKRLIL